jgi:hypothetical protein
MSIFWHAFLVVTTCTLLLTVAVLLLELSAMTGDAPSDCGSLRCSSNIAVDLYQHKACTEGVRVPTRGFILAIKQAFDARTVTSYYVYRNYTCFLISPQRIRVNRDIPNTK